MTSMAPTPESKLFRNLVLTNIALWVIGSILWVGTPERLQGPLAEYWTSYSQSDTHFALIVFISAGALLKILSFVGLLCRWSWIKHYTLVVVAGGILFDLLMSRPIVNSSAALAWMNGATLASGATLWILYFSDFGRN